MFDIATSGRFILSPRIGAGRERPSLSLCKSMESLRSSSLCAPGYPELDASPGTVGLYLLSKVFPFPSAFNPASSANYSLDGFDGDLLDGLEDVPDILGDSRGDSAGFGLLGPA